MPNQRRVTRTSCGRSTLMASPDVGFIESCIESEIMGIGKCARRMPTVGTKGFRPFVISRLTCTISMAGYVIML